MTDISAEQPLTSEERELLLEEFAALRQRIDNDNRGLMRYMASRRANTDRMGVVKGLLGLPDTDDAREVEMMEPIYERLGRFGYSIGDVDEIWGAIIRQTKKRYADRRLGIALEFEPTGLTESQPGT